MTSLQTITTRLAVQALSGQGMALDDIVTSLDHLDPRAVREIYRQLVGQQQKEAAA